jgi:hypothetical protein
MKTVAALISLFARCCLHAHARGRGRAWGPGADPRRGSRGGLRPSAPGAGRPRSHASADLGGRQSGPAAARRPSAAQPAHDPRRLRGRDPRRHRRGAGFRASVQPLGEPSPAWRAVHQLAPGRAAGTWTVRGNPGIGYFYVIASPVPLDFRGFQQPVGSRWDFSRVGRMVRGDPFLALDAITEMLVPRGMMRSVAVDVYSYHVGSRYPYPSYACYDPMIGPRGGGWAGTILAATVSTTWSGGTPTTTTRTGSGATDGYSCEIWPGRSPPTSSRSRGAQPGSPPRWHRARPGRPRRLGRGRLARGRLPRPPDSSRSVPSRPGPSRSRPAPSRRRVRDPSRRRPGRSRASGRRRKRRARRRVSAPGSSGGLRRSSARSGDARRRHPRPAPRVRAEGGSGEARPRPTRTRPAPPARERGNRGNDEEASLATEMPQE